MKYRNLGLGVCLLWLAAVPDLDAATSQTLFETGFEASEGYDTQYTLVNQNGWVGTDLRGNGLLAEGFTGQGQGAYVGYFPLTEGESDLVVWYPINFSPVQAAKPIVRFSVTMEIVDSDNDEYDDFRWSVYNIAGDRLFTIDFDNYDLSVNYLLDGTNGFVFTGRQFTNDTPHSLSITMDFARNRWGASLDGAILATNLPITTVNATLDLGDIDAVWLYDNVSAPGNNYMLFDNYRVTAEISQVVRPRLEPMERLSNGQFLLRVFGVADRRYAVEATSDLLSWIPLRTNRISDGSFDFLDTTATGSPHRFYRAREVP
jgi:hypothetical protein